MAVGGGGAGSVLTRAWGSNGAMQGQEGLAWRDWVGDWFLEVGRGWRRGRDAGCWWMVVVMEWTMTKRFGLGLAGNNFLARTSK